MYEGSCIKAHNIYPNLNDQSRHRLNKVSEVKVSFLHFHCLQEL